jgi:hypothetical protein
MEQLIWTLRYHIVLCILRMVQIWVWDNPKNKLSGASAHLVICLNS